MTDAGEHPKVVPISPDRAAPGLATGSDVELAERLVDMLTADGVRPVHTEGAFYWWNRSFWRDCPEPDLRTRLHRLDGQRIGDANGRPLKLTCNRIDGSLREAAAMVASPGFFDAAPPALNCLSGVVRINERGKPVLEAHHPDFRQRQLLNARFKGDLAGRPAPGSLLDRLLLGCFGNDAEGIEKARLLSEIAGAAAFGLAPHLALPRAFIFLGQTATNGKSQCLEIIRGLVPGNAVSAITPAQFAHDQYRAELAGKRVNTADEVAEAAIGSEMFKVIVTCNPVMAKRVYSPAFSFRPGALHAFATNGLPRFREGMDRGVRRRLQVLLFDRQVPDAEQIANLGERIVRDELDGLLAWAVAGACRLVEQGHFTDPPSGRAELANWIVRSDPVLCFLEDESCVKITGSCGDEVTTKEAYARFQVWARSEGLRNAHLPTHGQFTERVREAALEGVEIRRHGKRGNRLVGLKLLNGGQ